MLKKMIKFIKKIMMRLIGKDKMYNLKRALKKTEKRQAKKMKRIDKNILINKKRKHK
jgi:hypothetical protein